MAGRANVGKSVRAGMRGKEGWRLIERMKEERINRKDGALEETDKDLREQRWR